MQGGSRKVGVARDVLLSQNRERAGAVWPDSVLLFRGRCRGGLALTCLSDQVRTSAACTLGGPVLYSKKKWNTLDGAGTTHAHTHHDNAALIERKTQLLTYRKATTWMKNRHETQGWAAFN